MSWFFGGGGGNDDDADDDYDVGFDDDFDGDDDESVRVIADFDPSRLVEGAKALKEIDASENAKEVLKLASLREKTRLQELKVMEQERISQNMKDREQMMNADHQRRMEQGDRNQEQWKERAEHEQRLKQQMERELIQEKRRAQEEWEQKQRQFQEEQRAKDMENAKRIEEEKRRTLEYQAKLEQDTARVAAKAQTEGEIEKEQVNEDIHTRSLITRLSEERTTQIEMQKARLEAWKNFYSLVNTTLTDKEKLKTLGMGIVGISAGVYGMRTGISVTGKYVEKHFGKPSLVRETSRWSWRDVLPSNKWIRRFQTNAAKVEELEGVILGAGLENKMKFVARSTTKTKANGTPFRHLLIYGPPGTGKTLFARALSKESGLDYAVMTGGDFAQLGNSAVTELHKVFDWAESSGKGTILFIDEADAFLRKGRAGDKMSEDLRNALSAFLYRTGTETNKFKIVLATNVPEALDQAVLDRLDDVVEFPLPGPKERKRMLELYFKKYITHPEMGQPIQTVDFDLSPTLFDDLAEKTDGFSGRQIAKYMIQVQKMIYDGMDNQLSPVLMLQALEVFLTTKHFGVE